MTDADHTDTNVDKDIHRYHFNMLKQKRTAFFAFSLSLLFAGLVFFSQTYSARAQQINLDVGQDRFGAEAKCLILPSDTITIIPRSSEPVTQIFANRGDRVKKGDRLIEFESASKKIDYELLKSRAEDESKVKLAEMALKYALKAKQRGSRLVASKLIRRTQWEEILKAADKAMIDLDAAKHERELLKLQAEQARLELEKTIIYAPADSVVQENEISIGEIPDAQSGIKLVVNDPLSVELFVGAESFEQWQAEQKAGSPVMLELQIPEGRKVEAMIRSVDPVADAGTSILRVLLTLENKNKNVLAGQRCRFKLQGRKQG